MSILLKIIKILTFSFLVEDIVDDRDFCDIIGQIILWIIGIVVYIFLFITGWAIYQCVDARYQPLQHFESTVSDKSSYHVEETSYPVTITVNNIPITQMQYVPGYDVYKIQVKNFPIDVSLEYQDWLKITVGQHVSLDYRVSSGGLFFVEKIDTK